MVAAFVSAKMATGSLTCTKPTGVIDGDFLVAAVWGYDNNVQSGPAGGWTSRFNGSSGGARWEIWTHPASGDGANYTWGGTSNADTVIWAYRGASSTAAYNTGGSTDYGSVVGAPTSPSVTTTVDNCTLLDIAIFNHAGGAVTPPGSMAARSTDGYGNMAAADEQLGVAGATGTRTWTWSPTDTGSLIAVALAPSVDTYPYARQFGQSQPVRRRTDVVSYVRRFARPARPQFAF